MKKNGVSKNKGQKDQMVWTSHSHEIAARRHKCKESTRIIVKESKKASKKKNVAI